MDNASTIKNSNTLYTGRKKAAMMFYIFNKVGVLEIYFVFNIADYILKKCKKSLD